MHNGKLPPLVGWSGSYQGQLWNSKAEAKVQMMLVQFADTKWLLIEGSPNSTEVEAPWDWHQEDLVLEDDG